MSSVEPAKLLFSNAYYTGLSLKRQPHSLGCVLFFTGAFLLGNFKNGKLDGKALIFYPNGTCAYAHFIENVANGIFLFDIVPQKTYLVFQFEKGEVVDKIIKFDRRSNIKTVFDASLNQVSTSTIPDPQMFLTFTEELKQKYYPVPAQLKRNGQTFEIGSFETSKGELFHGCRLNGLNAHLGTRISEDSRLTGWFFGTATAGFSIAEEHGRCVLGGAGPGDPGSEEIVFDLAAQNFVLNLLQGHKAVEVARGVGFPYDNVAKLAAGNATLRGQKWTENKGPLRFKIFPGTNELFFRVLDRFTSNDTPLNFKTLRNDLQISHADPSKTKTPAPQKPVKIERSPARKPQDAIKPAPSSQKRVTPLRNSPKTPPPAEPKSKSMSRTNPVNKSSGYLPVTSARHQQTPSSSHQVQTQLLSHHQNTTPPPLRSKSPTPSTNYSEIRKRAADRKLLHSSRELAPQKPVPFKRATLEAIVVVKREDGLVVLKKHKQEPIPSKQRIDKTANLRSRSRRLLK